MQNDIFMGGFCDNFILNFLNGRNLISADLVGLKSYFGVCVLIL